MRKTRKPVLTLISALLMSMILLLPVQSYAADSDDTWIDKIESAISAGTLDSYDFNAALEQAKSADNSAFATSYLNAIRTIHNGDYYGALPYLDQALRLVRTSGDLLNEKRVLEKCIELNMLLDRRTQFQEYGMELKELSEDDPDEFYVKSLYVLAFSHFISFSDEMAEKYLDSILLHSENLNYSFGYALYYSLSGDIAYSYDDYEAALDYYKKAYDFALESDKNLLLPYSDYMLVRIAETLDALGRHLEAYDKLIGIDVKPLQNYTFFLREYYYHMADTQIQIEQYNTAILYLNRAKDKDLLIGGTEGEVRYEYNLCSLYAYAYYGLKDYENAAKHFLMYMENDLDSLSDMEYSDNISALFDYETRELEEELQLKSELKEVKENTIALQEKYLKTSAVLIVILLAILLVLLRTNTLKERMKKKLYIESITDHMTSIYNRNHIITLLEENLNENMCVILTDVDNFKSINDTYGHTMGDKVLIRIAQAIKSSVRPNDYVGRYGGEEFLIILREVELQSAREIAQRILTNVEDLEWDEAITTTLSIGLMQGYEAQPDIILSEVDALMYEAKNTGKNKIVY